MSDYRVSNLGHGIALGSLNVISPQPHSNGVESTRRVYAADGSTYDEARYIEMIFDFSEDPTTYVALLTLFGVNVSTTANVTIYAPDERLTYTRFNGIAHRPMPGKDMRRSRYFPRNIVLLVTNLAAA